MLVWSLLAYGVLAAVLTVSSLTAPVFAPALMGFGSAALTILGVVLAVRSRVTHGWWPRLGVGAVFSLLLFVLALRAWYAVANGTLFILTVIMTAALVGLAWALPAISMTWSTRVWRAQAGYQGIARQPLLRWGTALNLGAVGVVGAIVGTLLARSGHLNSAYLLVALGLTVASVLMAQGYSNRLWEDRPKGGRTP